jgi:phage tail sheath gpL-like
MNAATSPVTATVSANVITITSRVNGAATNYALSTSYRFDTTDFPNPGFTATPSGAQLTGGTD